VEEDGFETPMLCSELVVVLPAGHETPKNNARLMFDQSAVDAVKARDLQQREATKLTKEEAPAQEPELPVEETAHGEKISMSLAFEPADVKNLSKTGFAAVLVNDSNYYLALTFLTRADDTSLWTLAYQGTLEPNMVLDLATYTHEQLPGLSRVALQCVPFKKDKPFELKPAVSISRKLDLTKFYKLHCFRPGKYFDTPVLELPLLADDVVCGGVEENQLQKLAASFSTPEARAKTEPRRHRKSKNPADNPNVLLPLQEVDLHIASLTDSITGLENRDMMQLQLDTVRRNMNLHRRRKGQKIVFIHGKGDGVLRNAVRALLKKEYPQAEIQDASFREYGFGATLVTIH